MSTFRKAMLTTAVLGAGLVSTAAPAFATEGGHHHGDGHGHSSSTSTTNNISEGGCSNEVAAQDTNGADRTLADVVGGNQTIVPVNVCDFLNGNTILSGNNVAVGGSDIRNGDDRTVTRESTTILDGVL